VFRPDNCKGYSQKLLVATHILHLLHWKEYWDSLETDSALAPPDCLHVKVQGNPGTGKTFCIKTKRNITREIMGDMGHDYGTAPTGCAAAIIGGITNCRGFKLPVGKPAANAPSNWNSSSSSAVKAFFGTMNHIVHLIMDEDSMTGRPNFAWIRHRAEETRGVPLLPPCDDGDDNDTSDTFLESLHPRFLMLLPSVLGVGFRLLSRLAIATKFHLLE